IRHAISFRVVTRAQTPAGLAIPESPAPLLRATRSPRRVCRRGTGIYRVRFQCGARRRTRRNEQTSGAYGPPSVLQRGRLGSPSLFLFPLPINDGDGFYSDFNLG